MSTKIWSSLFAGLAVTGVALGYLANEALRLNPPDSIAYIIVAGAAGIGGTALLFAFRGVVHLRQATTAVAAEAHVDDHPHNVLTSPVTAVLRCLDAPIAVIGDRGGISAVNPAAIALLAPHGVAGASIYKALLRDDLTPALQKARGSRTPVTVELRRADGGAVVTVRVSDLGLQTGAVLVFDAPTLVGAPGPVMLRPGGVWGPPVDPEQPLAVQALTALTFDIVQGHVGGIRTVRLTGGRVFPTLSLEFTIAPPGAGGPGRPLGEVWPVLADALHGTAVVAAAAQAGWSALMGDLAAAGLAVPETPPLIELAGLARAYDPALPADDVDGLAAALNIAEPDPGRRVARVAARLAMGRDGNGLGPVGRFLHAGDDAWSGGGANNALQPAPSGSVAEGTIADR